VNDKLDRVPIRIPKPMINEIDRILKKSPMYGNRQQFVESAIREKIEKVRLTEIGLRVGVERIPPQNLQDNQSKAKAKHTSISGKLSSQKEQ
jgi:metal-responsive CopG/Arc/MetJ family transcriptional regulator